MADARLPKQTRGPTYTDANGEVCSRSMQGPVRWPVGPLHEVIHTLIVWRAVQVYSEVVREAKATLSP